MPTVELLLDELEFQVTPVLLVFVVARLVVLVLMLIWLFFSLKAHCTKKKGQKSVGERKPFESRTAKSSRKSSSSILKQHWRC
jgi:hypothetical protein